MNSLLLLAQLALPSTWLGLLLWVAIAAVVIWAIYGLIQWSGVTIPTPIRIVFIALACIFVIIFLFRVFNSLSGTP